MSSHLVYSRMGESCRESVISETLESDISAYGAFYFEEQTAPYKSYNERLVLEVGKYDRLVRVNLPWDSMNEAGQLLTKHAIEERITVEIKYSKGEN